MHVANLAPEPIPKKTGRHVRPKIKLERICPFCDYDEAELQFLVNCHAFDDIRIISSSGSSIQA